MTQLFLGTLICLLCDIAIWNLHEDAFLKPMEMKNIWTRPDTRPTDATGGGRSPCRRSIFKLDFHSNTNTMVLFQIKEKLLTIYFRPMIIDVSSKIPVFPIFWKTWHKRTDWPTDRPLWRCQWHKKNLKSSYRVITNIWNETKLHISGSTKVNLKTSFVTSCCAIFFGKILFDSASGWRGYERKKNLQ